jgi:hypothetical protein
LAGTSTSMSGTIEANSPGTYGGTPSLYVPYYPPNGSGNYGLQIGQTSDLGSGSYAGIGIGVQSGRTGYAIQVGSGGSALMYVSSTGAITSNATGPAINASNGDISSNNNLTTSTTTSASGTVNLADNSAGTQIANASSITYVLPASPSAGRKFVILRRGFGIQITPNGHTVWGPGATSNSSIFTPAASDITELYYNSVGSSWVIIQY